MKSIRDLVNKMPESRKSLEDYILNYSPEIREAIERNPSYKKTLEEIAGKEFDRYSQYFGSLTKKMSAAGHAIGYTADAWLLTGDIIGTLGGKFLNLLAQIPEKAYSAVYAIRTGNYLDSLQNIFEGLISYLPGLTIADQGLTRIIQKRMIKDSVYEMEKAIGLVHKPWHRRIYEGIKDKYTDVKNRAENVISPRRAQEFVPVPA